jgi:hypothetical protein
MIFLFEGIALYRLVHRYSEHGELEEFIANAPLEDVLRALWHSRSASLALMLATMMRLT